MFHSSSGTISAAFGLLDTWVFFFEIGGPEIERYWSPSEQRPPTIWGGAEGRRKGGINVTNG